MAMRTVSVDIYPKHTNLDGVRVSNTELEATVNEIYSGFNFKLCFTCPFANSTTVEQVKQILGI